MSELKGLDAEELKANSGLDVENSDSINALQEKYKNKHIQIINPCITNTWRSRAVRSLQEDEDSVDTRQPTELSKASLRYDLGECTHDERRR